MPANALQVLPNPAFQLLTERTAGRSPAHRVHVPESHPHADVTLYLSIDPFEALRRCAIVDDLMVRPSRLPELCSAPCRCLLSFHDHLHRALTDYTARAVLPRSFDAFPKPGCSRRSSRASEPHDRPGQALQDRLADDAGIIVGHGEDLDLWNGQSRGIGRLDAFNHANSCLAMRIRARAL